MIYALIIGIDNYPAPVPKLRGCINDATAIKTYLEGNYPGEDVHIKTLFNEEATKANIITGFQHFSAATAEDTCLLYYVGHGSQAVCPPEFRHLEPDGKIETIVCYDSRLPGGSDLMDKEQAYLIWEAVQKHEPHFVAVYDSCHAGNNTREMATPRMTDAASSIPQARNFHGYERYIFRMDGDAKHLEPPRGRHLQLAASRSNETAKELKIAGQTRGAFSYHLVSLLEQYNGALTYSELVTQLQGRIGNLVSRQHPQIHADDPRDKNRFFLGQVPTDRPRNYSVHYDTARASWVVNAGSMHNLPVDQADKIQLRVRDEHGTMLPAQVTKVDIMHAHLSGLDHLDISQTYLAIIDKIPVRELKLAFAPGSDPKGMTLVRQAMEDLASPYYLIHSDSDEADFWIRVQDNTLMLTLPGSERPVFRRLQGYTSDMAKVFAGDTQDVAYWHTVKSIQNPRTSLSDNDFEIELFRTDQPGEYLKDDLCPATKIDWHEPAIFNYDYDQSAPEGQRWLNPAFRVRIRNKSTRTLYFSAVAMLSNYLISNKFLPKIALPAGESVDLRELVGATEYKTIPLSVYDSFLNYGINEITEHLKIFVSTQELDTDTFNQDALKMDDVKPDEIERMGRGNSAYPPQHDWCVRDMALTVVRPAKEVLVQGGERSAVGNKLRIQLPTGTQCLAALNGRTASTRSMADAGVQLPELPTGWIDHDLGEGFSSHTPANMLELYNFQGAAQVSVDNPLVVELDNGGEEGDIVPVAYDEETGLYYPVGLMQADGIIRIDSLPTESAVGTRSLGGSIKIFFQKTIGKYIPYVYQHPQLAIGRLVEDSEEPAGYRVEYTKELAAIKSAVQAADRIVMYIHGIIGDTTEMPKSFELVEGADAKKLADRYDLMLTFDYENLDTKIQDTAVLLKQKLAEVGLAVGHGKQFDIIAHSMGGLVSRWMIEKEEGNAVVRHLYQLGTPNQGSPYGSIYEMATPLLAKAVNGAAFLKPYILPLRFAGKFLDKLFTTLKQMNPKSDFYKALNDGSDPGIPYTIIAGNTRLIGTEIAKQQATLFQKLMTRFKTRGHYDALDLLFRAPNDIAVSTESIREIPGAAARKYPPVVVECACDHLSYFADPAGLNAMADCLGD